MSRILIGAVLLVSTSRVVAQSESALAPGASSAVAAALELARQNVRMPSCRLLLHSYSDQEGRPLARNLASLGASASDYLRWLVFRPAPASAGRCHDRSVVFYTVPGSRVVFVCEERVADLAPSLAGALVLHEALHTLGLGENPPSPAQITARVRERCGM